MRRYIQLLTLPAFALVLFAQLMSPAQAVEIKTVISAKGIKALLVENYTVPLIAVSFSFKGGTTQDLKGKGGTAQLLSNMLDEGAGDISSQAFQEALDDNGMNYSFNAGLDSFSGGIKTLKESAPRAFELLSLMLNKPRFDEKPLGRMKATHLNSMRSEETNPQAIIGKAFRKALFKSHPYARNSTGTMETMGALAGADLEDYRKRVFVRENLVIGVVGAINPEELKQMLDQVFGGLPIKSKLITVPEFKVKTGEISHIEFDTPQTNIRLALPGLKRDDPEFYTAYLVNYVLGGGSFSSRLYNEVREKRGLAYGVYSYLGTYDHTGIIGSGTATRSERTDQALKVILEEISRMAKEGPTAEELEKAKKYIIGSYAISNLDTSDKIASTLVAIQTANLGIDYIDKRAEYISAVTLEDAKRVAAKLFSGSPTIITVGKKQK
ncbi:MAG: pitrilysin family protein [Rhizobiaceae bacterium]